MTSASRRNLITIGNRRREVDVPLILLAGDIEFDHAFLGELEMALRNGSRVLMAPRHRKALGSNLARLAGQGAIEVCEPSVNAVTHRPAAISNQRLRNLADQYLPIEVTGDPVQYQINRIPNGWVIELINNRGVVKRPNQPAVTDPAAIARVVLRPRTACKTAQPSGRARTLGKMGWRDKDDFDITEPGSIGGG